MEFHFVCAMNRIKYQYGFSATRGKVLTEYPYHVPRGQKVLIFSREGQKFAFTEEKTKRGVTSEMIAENQLFFSVTCIMNDSPCTSAIHWYWDHVLFSGDHSGIPRQLLAYSEDRSMFRVISNYARTAGLGIQDMCFGSNGKEIRDDVFLPDNIPDGIKSALV